MMWVTHKGRVYHSATIFDEPVGKRRLTSTMLGYMAVHGVDYTLRKSDAVFIRALDSQRAADKTLFGAGFLISEKAAAEKAAAEKAAAEKAAAEKAAAGCAPQTWELSEREREIIKRLGGNNDD